MKDLSIVTIRIHNIHEISVQEFVTQYANCLDVISECIGNVSQDSTINSLSASSGDSPTITAQDTSPPCSIHIETFTEECITLTFRGQRLHQLIALQTALEIDHKLRLLDHWLDLTIGVGFGTVITGTLGNQSSRVIRSFGTACTMVNNITIIAKHLQVSLLASESVVQKAIGSITKHMASSSPSSTFFPPEFIIQRYADLMLLFPDHPGSKTPTQHKVIQVLDLNVLHSQTDVMVTTAIEPIYKDAETLFRLTNECWAHIEQGEFAQVQQIYQNNRRIILDDMILQRIKNTAEYCQSQSLGWKEYLEQQEEKLMQNRPWGLGFLSLLLG
eukprot:CAMPEP_0117436406 /NCGR_PEP_ID=MMETSP0759-20121206/990_1 /TAXON_ID=63605 /ORGANISM="Percolomonas cosmopolitus, Strain WS" /LENGTH=329 /DNA_ID=CAMNT_0005228003 /DNA_START=975 /DNA_END=1964 /DNA_ORIENTATION=+